MPTALIHKIQSVQVSRGVAAILVLMFHATSASNRYFDYNFAGGVFLFGYSGVDFFFVLSGFIIFLAHRNDLGRSDRLGPYLKKRFVRIYPIYWVVALALVPVYFHWPQHPSEYVVLLKSFLLLPQVENPVISVGWSLTHEVFFYIIFGLAICFPWRYVRPVVATGILISALFYLGKVLTGGTFHPPAHSGFIFSSYNLEFAMGCTAAYLLVRQNAGPGRARWITLIGILIFFASGLTHTFLYSKFGLRHSVLSYGFSSMLIVYGSVQFEKSNKVVIPSALLLLGDASYSIYLTHFALLDLFLKGLRTLSVNAIIGPALATWTTVAFSLSIGVLFYLYIERPLLARLRKRNQPVSPADLPVLVPEFPPLQQERQEESRSAF